MLDLTEEMRKGFYMKVVSNDGPYITGFEIWVLLEQGDLITQSIL
jgi:hypothetical protein